MSSSPRSIRFDEAVLDKLSRFVADHPEMSVSTAVNRLVMEALRMEEHKGILFRSGPSGRRAGLAAGPDVWEVIRAVKTTRAADPDSDPEEIIASTAEYSGLSIAQVKTAIDYWAAYPEEIDGEIEAARIAEAEAEQRWRRERDLLVS